MSAFDDESTRLAQRQLRRDIFRRTVDALLEGMEPVLVESFLAGAAEVTLERGTYLMHQGDSADAWYVLTSGRLSVTTQSAQGQTRVADLLPGASVGEIALITGGARIATVRAEREASLMRLSKSDFERFADAHPAFARRLTSMIVQRLSEPAAARRGQGGRVMVVLRAGDATQFETTAQQLGATLMHVANAAVLSRTSFERLLGHSVDSGMTADHPVWNRFDLWVEEAQRAHALVLLDAGHGDAQWQRECLLHADHCLWLADPIAPSASAPPAELLARLEDLRQLAERDSRSLPWSLLLVHPADTTSPENTRAWLEAAPFERHHHLRLGDDATMQRAARLLAGKGIGLALSGGGARGFAHIGALQAFIEAGVPIDCIGGTSFGAIQAGMFAMGLSIERIIALNREVIAMRPFKEYTLPLIALIASNRRDASMRHAYGELRIEDLWLPYLAVSTDLRAARGVVHERGLLRLAISASSALPGVLVPVPDGERILVDGGIVNNLPADLVKARCGGTVFGVKVVTDDDLSVPAGGFPSPWALLRQRLLSRREPIRTPRIGDLMIRTMTVSDAERMQRVVASLDVLIEPDVADFGMLQFGAIDALIERGHAATTARLGDWREGDTPESKGINLSTRDNANVHRSMQALSSDNADYPNL